MHPRDLLTSLISSLRFEATPTQSQTTPSSNPLINAPASVRNAILTLHVLFPHELLPALDLLDRNLVTRLVLVHQQDEAQHQVSHSGDPQRLPSGDEQVRTQADHRQLRDQLSSPPPHQRTPERETPHRSSRSEVPSAPSQHQIPLPPDETGLDGQDSTPDHERPPAGHPAHASHPGDADTHMVRFGQLPPGVRAPPEGVRSPRGAAVAFLPRHPHHADAYVVRSGQQVSSRVRASEVRDRTTPAYEVRLRAWSCSCPAFAFAAFPAMERNGGDGQVHQLKPDWQGKQWRFGGLTLGSDVPVCKHLLACVLVEHSEVFASLVEERQISENELAGWAAGWGD